MILGANGLRLKGWMFDNIRGRGNDRDSLRPIRALINPRADQPDFGFCKRRKFLSFVERRHFHFLNGIGHKSHQLTAGAFPWNNRALAAVTPFEQGSAAVNTEAALRTNCSVALRA